MSKKPAKTPTDFINKKVEVPGKSIMYIGMGDSRFICPTCSRTFSKGMIYEHSSKYYCSRACIIIN